MTFIRLVLIPPPEISAHPVLIALYFWCRRHFHTFPTPTRIVRYEFFLSALLRVSLADGPEGLHLSVL